MIQPMIESMRLAVGALIRVVAYLIYTVRNYEVWHFFLSTTYHMNHTLLNLYALYTPQTITGGEKRTK